MIDKIKENTLNTINPILSFNDFIGSQKNQGYSHALITNEYIPIAESLLESTSFVLTESQRCILEFVKEHKLNPNSWHLLKEDSGYFQKVKDWFSENFFKSTENIIGGAVDWIKKLGSDLSNAVSSVISKIMEEIKEVWESVKVETNSWYLGNKSLKRQVTMSINQQLDSVTESLNENSEDFMAELTKESSQLSNMFVESVNNIIEGEAFASKVTMSINKIINESNKPDHLFNASLNESVMNLIPSAINEGVLDINSLSNPVSKRNIRRFNESHSVNEAFEFIDSFFKWCIDKLTILPPFNWLKEWTNELELKDNLNESLERASVFLSKYFGVPGPYKFEKLNPIYTVIVSGLIEFGKFSLVQKLLAMFIFPIPILGPAVSFLLTIYGFFILAQVIFELIEGYNNSELQDAQPEPAN